MTQNSQRLRRAVARGDGAEVVQLVSGGWWPADALQVLGDGLVVALDQQVPGAPQMARRCVAELRARSWAGDDELAAVVLEGLKVAPAGSLNPLMIDLSELTMVLEGDPVFDGRGPFGRFKHALAQWPDLLERWFAFAEDRERGRARLWLADQGYVVRPKP